MLTISPSVVPFKPLRLYLLLVWVSLFVSVSVQANTSLTYYDASVPVRSQEIKERQYAAQKGLQEVLVRMSGSEQTLDNASVQQAVGQALRYVEAFEYRIMQDEVWLERGYGEQVLLSFSPTVVKRILRDASQAFWPENRPKVLLWLVEDTEEGKRMVGDNPEHPLVGAIEDVAVTVGLPLAVPLLDLRDQQALSAKEAWRLDENALTRAAERYRAEVVLAGRLFVNGRGEQIATWQFWHRDDTQTYDSRAQDLTRAGYDALDPLVTYLAERYAVMPSVGGERELLMQVSGVGDFKAYSQVMRYLSGIAMVRAVSLVAVEDQQLLLFLRTDADQRRLANTLSLDNKLFVQDDSVPVVRITTAGSKPAVSTELGVNGKPEMAAEQTTAQQATGQVLVPSLMYRWGSR